MYATERQAHITRHLAERGRVSVVGLADDLGVTTETIRRDLDALEQQGLLRRVHGGAVPSRAGSVSEPSIAERMTVNSDAKLAIARRALEVITDGYRGAVVFDAGSTVGAVAAGLGDRVAATGARLDVVTHAVPVAHTLSLLPDIGLTLLGGQVRGLTAAAVGPSTLSALGSLRPDLAFVGANGVSAGFGLSTPDPAEAAVKAAIVRSAQRVIAVADRSKFGVESFVRFADLAEIDILVTDAAPDEALASALAAADVEVWIA
ncbi:DeoR/GlpR transcriptional regulator [Microbacterium sp. 4R-513]|uniref:DeoR/GlpR family DNA-binding transcription regulator n=1 Tax=Microbacterium sp. 4R-513 TaxID=2567934 RepID=UPI0013E1A6B2|nr:DeoR/GlpR family DNA-binding transcription regulator [Microbacterium sp. 4R-513]QIG40433.1 DeoR/GlpR transcriptional regulator [Microbacterium sp. 4R-513]